MSSATIVKRDRERARRVISAVVAVLLSAIEADPSTIERALANPALAAAYRALDVNRQPDVILTFGGVRPGTQILDVGTGGGHFTEMSL